MSIAAARERIGRFELVRELGRGAQGAVHLAIDTRLGRQVALKTLLLEAGADKELIGTLLDEARIVSTLAHPNIVTLYDAGEARGSPYLVFEYVEGRTLASLIREKGRLPVPRAVEIAIALAQGVGYAHERGIVHRDLKPGNVMLSADGVPRLMDFGIARRSAADEDPDAPFVGTPSYMAPEYIGGRGYQATSDVFALGVLLYEMLTGEPPVRDPDPHRTLERIVKEPFRPPSARNPDVDEALDGVVMRALAKDPQARFESCASLERALANYLEPEPLAPAGDGADATLEFLLRRISHKSDFPALSTTISAVNRIAASDREPVSVLCNAILKDFALTNRLLKMVNAACYKQFGGSISTVSRAVTLLGFGNVRNVAMSLLLFEHLHGRTNAAALRDEVVTTYFSGLLARELLGHAGVHDAEQALICAMFHRLGRMLATFYLHDESRAVERLMRSRGWDEHRASRQVLGLSYEDLGVGVARAWKLPAEIIDCMRGVHGELRHRPVQESERLRLLAALATGLAEAVRADTGKERARRLAALVDKYGRASGATASSMTAGVQAAAAALERDAEVLGIARGSGYLAAALSWGVDAGMDAGAGAALAADATQPLQADAQSIVAQARLGATDNTTAPLTPSAPAGPSLRQLALAAGVQDITSTLVGDHELNDVLRIILETMYRGIGFTRVLLFVLDPAQRALRCRLGFGAEAESIVQEGVCVPLGEARDLFFAAISQGADLCVEDLERESVRRYVPDWYRAAIQARGMLLLPIVNRKRTVGLIYADAEQPETLRFSADELGLLKTLRNQALLAMRQKL